MCVETSHHLTFSMSDLLSETKNVKILDPSNPFFLFLNGGVFAGV